MCNFYIILVLIVVWRYRCDGLEEDYEYLTADFAEMHVS